MDHQQRIVFLQTRGCKFGNGIDKSAYRISHKVVKEGSVSLRGCILSENRSVSD